MLSRGFSLVELMTATAIGLLLMSAVVWAFVEVAGGSRRLIERAQLDQTLLSALSLMSGELRRAGYWSRAWKTLDGAALNGYAPVNIPSEDCLLYSYDREKNDADGAPGAEDQHGLRLAAGAVQIKTSDDGCGAATCESCSGGNWSALTDPRTVFVERLAFRLVGREQPFDAGRHLARVRAVEIELRGSLRRDPAVARTLRTTVDIRNDEIR